MRVIDLGRDVPYATGMAAMREAMERVDVDGPVLLLQEHTPTITVTRSGGTSFVTSSPEALAALGIDLVETDRGGDVTFHGPGQLVGYPVLRLSPPGERGDLLGYLRALETSLVDAAKRLGIPDAHRVDGMTGVWCDAPVVDEETLGCHFNQVSRQECKLTAIGVGVGKGVTRHGFALNMTTDLERYTRHIVPCGLVGRGVTSLERVLPKIPSRDDVIRVVVDEVLRALEPLAGSPSSPAAIRPAPRPTP
jgi:lipoyl(octanoyl) transferase